MKFLFYSLYLIFKKVAFLESEPRIPAFVYFCIIQYILAVSIINYFSLLTFGMYSEMYTNIVSITLVVLYNFFFIYRQQKVIINKYDKISSGKKILGILSLLILTVIVCIFAIYSGKKVIDTVGW